MKIYESAVRKPVSTVLMFVGVMVFGLFSLMNLAVDQYPEIEIPQISVITFYPGANAADIETNITRILEDNLNTVSNLKKLTSKSQDNVSMIIVEFEYGSDLTEGANEIRDVVSRSQSQLPDDIDYPTIFKFSTSMIPVIMLAVTADESYPALKKILDDKFVNVLNRVDGVGAVTVMGAPEREVQVNVDPAKLEAYNLTVEQLGQIIAAENVNIPERYDRHRQQHVQHQGRRRIQAERRDAQGRGFQCRGTHGDALRRGRDPRYARKGHDGRTRQRAAERARDDPEAVGCQHRGHRP